MPEPPGHGFLFDLIIPRLPASPEGMTPTRVRSWDDLETDLLDPGKSLGSQATSVWEAIEEPGGVLHRSVPFEGDTGNGAGGPTANEAHVGGEKGREAAGLRARPCKRRRG